MASERDSVNRLSIKINNRSESLNNFKINNNLCRNKNIDVIKMNGGVAIDSDKDEKNTIQSIKSAVPKRK